MVFMNAQYVLPVSQAAVARDGRVMKPETKVLKKPKRRSLLRREERAIHERTMKDISNNLSSAIRKIDYMQKTVDSLHSEVRQLHQKEKRKVNKLQARKE